MTRNERIKKAEERIRRHKRPLISSYLREVIYGAVDGIITTFAVVAGFSGAALSNDTTTQISFMMVLLFGLANLFADGASMGLGNFLAVRSEQGLYRELRRREEHASEENGSVEAHETKVVLMENGFSESDAHTLTEIYRKNEPYWVEFILHNELKISNPLNENPVTTALTTFVAFVTFGCIPLIPFMVLKSSDPQVVFQMSAVGALSALIILGILKWRVIGTGIFKSIFEVVAVGSVAASAAFFVGSFFSF